MSFYLVSIVTEFDTRDALLSFIYANFTLYLCKTIFRMKPLQDEHLL